MASYIYYTFKEECLDGTRVDDGTIAAHLCGGVPAVDAADPVIGDVTDGATGTTATPELTSPSFTSGVLDTTDDSTTFTGISGGGPFTNLVVYKKTGTNAGRLMCNIDISSVSATGGNIIVDWDDATSMNGETGGIFAL